MSISDVDEVLNSERYRSIIRRLTLPKEKFITFFPPMFQSGSLKLVHYLTEDYFSLTFFNERYEKRIRRFLDNLYDPFPGLIKPRESDDPVAYTVNESKNLLFQNVTVRNMYSFSLGKDTTLILDNYLQSIKTLTLGEIEYIIDLSYIISFGNEISLGNFYDYLEDAIIYTINVWRSPYIWRSDTLE